MNDTPSPRPLSRVKLLLIVGVFVVPFLLAWALINSGWLPSTSSHGERIKPQISFIGIKIKLDNGKSYMWRDSEPRWTLVALSGSDCMDNCLHLLHLMHNARITLNANADQLRLLYVGQSPRDAHAEAVMRHWQLGTDAEHKLDAFRPLGPDSVAAILVEPNGTALTRYRAGFDPNGLKDDLQKVIR